jgi:hypothetical protein
MLAQAKMRLHFTARSLSNFLALLKPLKLSIALSCQRFQAFRSTVAMEVHRRCSGGSPKWSVLNWGSVLGATESCEAVKRHPAIVRSRRIPWDTVVSEYAPEYGSRHVQAERHPKIRDVRF